MKHHENKNNIAIIDADYYVINYKSTITTYIQNVCNNILRSKRENINDQNADKRKIIICIFMLKIFLINIENNLNLFDFLYDVINKYHYLINNEKAQSSSCKEKVENNKINSNNFSDNKFEQANIGIVSKTNQVESPSAINKNVQKKNSLLENISNLNSKLDNDTEKVTKAPENENSSQNTLSIESNNNSNPHITSSLMHNLIIDKYYDNIDNVLVSKIGLLKIKNYCHINNNNSSSENMETNNYNADKNGDISASTNNKLKWKNMHKKGDTYIGTDSISFTHNDNVGISNPDDEYIPDIYSDEFDDINSDNSQSNESCLKNTKSGIVCDSENYNKFLINYNKIKFDLKHFSEFFNLKYITNEISKKKKNYEEKTIKYIEKLYRIIILSKLHIGAYNFLKILKKKKFYFIFYSSNKNLTNFLFKYFKISKLLKGNYTIIDSFDELKKYEACKFFLVFSNRSCFITHMKRGGYFKIVSGNKNKNSISTNCDDIDYEDIKIYNYDNQIENKDSDCNDNKLHEHSSTNIPNESPNKSNDVVYPLSRNCNLTEDIYSWRILYIFNKYIYIYGKVVKGFGRGSKYLNIPTANIFNANLTEADIMPGIYFGISKLKHKIYKTVVSIGYNPYFQNKHITIEAFLYYKTNNLFYDENIELIIVGILRSESNFYELSHLIHAIQFDCELARIALNQISHDQYFKKCKNYLSSCKHI
ncbi:riboflavin kinase / FAD synthase family protein, putative [Plasmodium berghei]|uniref:riboflavin kinase n=2 Tax=Plasmodium berghei TaxID=5821 RepID=A0A509APG7_PLABA|nr:riboflavin kinase, putative [Plasmodium berghei ANKA]CXI67593.1 riboflavin kinase / FAD synthase family protein, putative [Plasmodium berghei]SCM24138.1 riboflavin kinase / FAD synthase family protein, putative [Plasmodium berghei]SCN26945.1 riboflavin kinase / FAD synthase family protein, putative [Plasmodium berghei]SCO61389.1 riboflavin kinase / FAD synthase family protein, putative [Plasmodium berghei]SCO63366.1 riboflavin kinase / FAD synthase family protein, putative [Plasmodium bergh|eukprot:XP_034422561.1 riboflavin kinase, putative [Plasmodium berghei ANKA]